MEKFLNRFLNLEGSFLRFIVGTAALTIVLQVGYDLVDSYWGLSGDIILAIGLLAVVTILLVIDYQRHRRANQMVVNVKNAVDPHRGLIVLISPRGIDLPLTAVGHHAEELEHCWLVSSSQSLVVADEVDKMIHQRWPQVKVHDVMDCVVDPEDVESAWQIINHIFQQAQEIGLNEEDVIADITGGTKPMTAGMALACISPHRNMEYIKTPRDDKGDLISDAPRVPMLVTTSPWMINNEG